MADNVIDQLLSENSKGPSEKDKPEKDKPEKDKVDKSKTDKEISKPKDKGKEKKPTEKPYQLRGQNPKEPTPNLGDIMERGFASLKECFTSFSSNMNNMADSIVDRLRENMDDGYDIEDEDEYCSNEVVQDSDPCSGDILENMTSDYLNAEETSHKLNDKLSKLIDTLMSQNPNDDIVKTRNKKYLRPANCNNLTVPKMNPEIWNSVPSYSRNHDLAFQKLQQNLVKGVMPIAQVIEKLYSAKDDISSDVLDCNDLVKTLVDAVGFAGAANLDIIKKRKELVKHKLAPKFQKLCSGNAFSATTLFGDNLAQEVKEINDMGKLTNDISKPGSSGYVPF